MNSVVSGWGPIVNTGEHYGTTYKTRAEMTALAVASIRAGLQSGEQVLYSVAPAWFPEILDRLEQEVPDLNRRIAQQQLQQRMGIQCVHAWKHGGREGLSHLLNTVLADAREASYPGVRWVWQANLLMSEATSAADWYGMERGLAALLSRTEPPCTVFGLYYQPDDAEPVHLAPSLSDGLIRPDPNVQRLRLLRGLE